MSWKTTSNIWFCSFNCCYICADINNINVNYFVIKRICSVLVYTRIIIIKLCCCCCCCCCLFQTYDLLVGAPLGRAEWKFVTTEDGGRCVMITGTPRTRGLSAGVWGMLMLGLLRSGGQYLGKDQEISSWMIWIVTGMNRVSLTVLTMG